MNLLINLFTKLTLLRLSSTPCFNTVNLCFFLNSRDQILHPYETTFNIRSFIYFNVDMLGMNGKPKILK